MNVKDTYISRGMAVVFVYGFINGIYNHFWGTNAVLFWLSDIIGHLIIPLLIAIFLFKRAGLTLSHVNLTLPEDERGWMRCIYHTIIVSILFFYSYKHLYILFASWFPPEKYPPVFVYQSTIPDNFFLKLGISTYYGLTAGLIEEFYYHGLLVLIFTSYTMSKPFMVIVISALFTMVHWTGGPAQILSVFFLTIITTTYYVTFRLLWPLIIAHFMYDWIVYMRTGGS